MATAKRKVVVKKKTVTRGKGAAVKGKVSRGRAASAAKSRSSGT